MVEVLADSAGLGVALSVLRKGGVLVYPTETSYGIGCDFTNKKSVERIYEIKRRPSDMNFILLVDSLRTIGTYAKIDDTARRMAHAFMPGALTLIVPAYYGGTLAFRVSSHPFAQELCRQFRKPIVSTSANISGSVPIYDIDEIRKVFGGKVDVIVDGGNLPRRPATTLYDIAKRSALRSGGITEEEIKAAIRQ